MQRQALWLAQVLPTRCCRSCSPSVLRRQQSTLTKIAASPAAKRQAPTPLLFLSASRLGRTPAGADHWAKWTAYFSEQGWESLVLDVDLSEEARAKATSGRQVLEALEEQMVKTLRSSSGGSPFPPALLSKGWLASLAAQQYAASNPLSALVLIDPAISSARAFEAHADVLRSEPEEPNFEARFPIQVAWSTEEMQKQKEAAVPWYEAHRIEHELEHEADEALDRIIWADVDAEGPKQVAEWLEEEVGLLDRDDGDEEASAAEQEAAPTGESALPEWFTSGNYSFNPTRSKKMPLLLDETHLRERFIRGSGPGGQAINKLSTNVELVHEPTGARVTCQETRSRETNRMYARRRMSIKLEDMIKGGKGSVQAGKADRLRRRKANRAKKQKRQQRGRTEA